MKHKNVIIYFQRENRVKIKYNLFSIFYRIGVVIAFFMAISESGILGINSIKCGSYLLIVGIAHMIVIYIIAFFLISDSEYESIDINYRSFIAKKIQTAGYLHTLIGFVTILFTIQKSQLNIDNLMDPLGFIKLMDPLGYAFTTSILGWFLGGELEEKPKKFIVDEKLKEVISILNDFCLTIKDTTTHVSKQMNDTTKYFKKNLTYSANILKKEAEDFVKNYSNIETEHKNNFAIINNTYKEKIDSLIDVHEGILTQRMKKLEIILDNQENTIKSNITIQREILKELTNEYSASIENIVSGNIEAFETASKSLNESFKQQEKINNSSVEASKSLQESINFFSKLAKDIILLTKDIHSASTAFQNLEKEVARKIENAFNLEDIEGQCELINNKLLSCSQSIENMKKSSDTFTQSIGQSNILLIKIEELMESIIKANVNMIK